MEKERDDEKEKSTKLKQLLVKSKKDASEAKEKESERLSNDAVLKAQLQSYNLEIESYKLQLADLSMERQKLFDKLHSQGDLGQRSIQLLELKVKSLEEQLVESTAKFDSLQVEYDNYKVKVQHAFKKQKEQNESSTSLANSSEIQAYVAEIEKAKQVLVELSESLLDESEKVKILEKENEMIQEEYSKALDRNTKLLTELKEKEAEWKTK